MTTMGWIVALGLLVLTWCLAGLCYLRVFRLHATHRAGGSADPESAFCLPHEAGVTSRKSC